MISWKVLPVCNYKLIFVISLLPREPCVCDNPFCPILQPLKQFGCKSCSWPLPPTKRTNPSISTYLLKGLLEADSFVGSGNGLLLFPQEAWPQQLRKFSWFSPKTTEDGPQLWLWLRNMTRDGIWSWLWLNQDYFSMYKFSPCVLPSIFQGSEMLSIKVK